ncbi:uncharacterized protein LOC111456316 [Cucurbita moschata]|uniref:Uncharacterized protein LOC111456316 n=1 Tax=Cucurbita moschata TaxID=3662 RepID=A0A6J1GPN1_CUCMO|nr:uncharacterized protein LOC111456316 [Cucurbita moschata]
MPRKNSNVGRRAWNFLRLAIIWARKGGVFKRRFLMDHLRLVPKFIKTLGHSTPRGHLHYGDHELSFDETPVFHIKMHRPTSMRFHLPCITPETVDFEYEFEDDCDSDDDGSEVHSQDSERRSSGYEGGEEQEDEEEVEENGIDLRAEKFIAKFYEQMKMQRQISFSQYDKNH